MIAPAARWPGATQRPVSYAGQAGTIGPLGWAMHVVVGNGSPWATFEQAQSPKRRFSHLWVAKDGHAEQYASLRRASWAQGAGNDTYWSIETEGMPDEPLTDAQIQTLAAFHVWSGTPDHLANTPGEPGIGTHQMGGQAWGGHTCPDPAMGLPGPRSRQRQAILDAAQAIRNGGTDVPLTQADADLVVATLLKRQPGGTAGVTVGIAMERAALGVPAIQASLAKPLPISVDLSASAGVIAAAVVAALPAGNGLTPAQVTEACRAGVAAALRSVPA